MRTWCGLIKEISGKTAGQHGLATLLRHLTSQATDLGLGGSTDRRAVLGPWEWRRVAVSGGRSRSAGGAAGDVGSSNCRTIRPMTVPGLAVDDEQLRGVCRRYGVARLEVFGSVSRGDASPASDVDVLYELEPGARLGWDIEKLADELSEILGRRSIWCLATRCTSACATGCSPRPVCSMQREVVLIAEMVEAANGRGRSSLVSSSSRSAPTACAVTRSCGTSRCSA